MNGIFGIFRRDGGPVARETLTTMRSFMVGWKTGEEPWISGPVGFSSIAATDDRGNVLVAASRLDNGEELRRLLQVPEAQTGPDDGGLILSAWRKWGESCVERLFGDWAFALWNPAEQRLLLARDHFGITALYYYLDDRMLAFASDRKALLALHVPGVRLDELFLAQVLMAWPAFHSDRTIHTSLRRLPPAHAATVTPNRTAIRRYWILEQTPELTWRRREDYVEAFRELFEQAVRTRLQPPKDVPFGLCSRVGSMLSGGLDSSSVTATAARLLAAEGRCLSAFTSVPLSDTTPFVGERFGDEWPLALETARFAGNVEVHRVEAREPNPVEAIREALQIHQEPGHAAGNLFWIIALERMARDQGCRILLSGQAGNAGMSWVGDPLSQPFRLQFRRLGWRRLVREHFLRRAPDQILRFRMRKFLRMEWLGNTALRRDVAVRLRLAELWLEDPANRPARNAREKRRWVRAEGCIAGALHAEMGAAHQLQVRDPSADAQVLAFSFSAPDWVFMNPEDGADRWLLRAATERELPGAVRLNRRRGRQAGDLVPRLRLCAREVEDVLREIECGPGAGYVDLERMRQVWTLVSSEDSVEAHAKAALVLTRGIMCGLFVNSFEHRP